MTERFSARSKKEDGTPMPSRQRMAAEHRIRRNPSTDQKKVRRQLAKSATEGESDSDVMGGDSEVLEEESFSEDAVVAARAAMTPGRTAAAKMASRKTSAALDYLNWSEAGEKYRPGVKSEIPNLEWLSPDESLPMSQGLVINKAIQEFKIPSVKRVAWNGLTQGRYSLIGIEAQYSNGLVRIFIVDYGNGFVPVASGAVPSGATASRKVGSITCPECGNTGTIKEEDFRGSASNPVCTSCGAQFMADGSDPWAKSGSHRTASWIDAARGVLDNGIWDENGKEKLIDGMLLDAYTASGLVQVYDALSPEMQSKFDSTPLEQAVGIMWKLLKKTGSKTASAKWDPDLIADPGTEVAYQAVNALIVVPAEGWPSMPGDGWNWYVEDKNTSDHVDFGRAETLEEAKAAAEASDAAWMSDNPGAQPGTSVFGSRKTAVTWEREPDMDEEGWSEDTQFVNIDNEWGDNLSVFRAPEMDDRWHWSFSQSGPGVRSGRSGTAATEDEAKMMAVTEYGRYGGSLDLDGSVWREASTRKTAGPYEQGWADGNAYGLIDDGFLSDGTPYPSIEEVEEIVGTRDEEAHDKYMEGFDDGYGAGLGGYTSSKDEDDVNGEEVEGLDTDQTWLDNEEQWQKDASVDRYGRPIKTHATLSPETDLFL